VNPIASNSVEGGKRWKEGKRIVGRSGKNCSEFAPDIPPQGGVSLFIDEGKSGFNTFCSNSLNPLIRLIVSEMTGF